MNRFVSLVFVTLACTALGQTTPPAGTVTDIDAGSRLTDSNAVPLTAVVGPNAHPGICAIWAKQSPASDGLITNVVTATGMIDATDAGPAQSRQVRDLLPAIDVDNTTVAGLHTPSFRVPWTNGCTAEGGDLGGVRFAVRMRGNLHIESPGTKTFVVYSDDGYQFKIGNQIVMAYDANRGPQRDSRRTTFSAAGVYPIEITYWDQGGIALLETFMANGAICFDGSGTQGTCGGAFGDVSNSNALNAAGFEILNNSRLDVASWATPADTCAPFLGVGNSTCRPSATLGCGNGVVDLLDTGATEACDDGNLVNGDGCSSTCTVESSYVCGPPQVSRCVPTAPVVTAPANASSTSNTQPTITGTGIAGLTVTVRIDGSVACTAVVSMTGSWSCTPMMTLAVSSHTVNATQSDSAARTSANSNTNTFTIDVTAPAAAVLSTPTSGSLLATSTPTLSGTAEAGATVRASVDGTVVCQTIASATGAWSCDVPTGSPLSQGAHSATATATDAAGNASPVSNTNTFTIDSVAPGLPAISQPTINQGVNTNRPTYQGTGEVGATVRVFVDGSGIVACSTVVASDGTWSCQQSAPGLSEGAHNASATAIDAAGNSSGSTALRPFTVDTLAPAEPSILAPVNNSVSATAAITFSGTAEPNSQLTVRLDGSMTAFCTVSVTAQGTWSCPVTTLSEGPHTAVATSTDAAGNSASSSVTSVRIDTTAPTAPVIDRPVLNSTVSSTTPTFSGTAEANSRVRVVVDGTQVCVVTANASGAFTCPLTSALSQGAHTAVATAIDAAGNVSPASMSNTFAVDSIAPAAPVIARPIQDAVLPTSTPTLSGTAEANSLVTVSVDGTVVCSSVRVDAMGAWSCVSPALSEGAHSATATATDAAGNVSAASTAQRFSTRTIAPPAPSIAAPAQNSVTNNMSPTVSGTGTAGATVSVFVDGNTAMPACTATVDAQGRWSCLLPAQSNGPHTLTATQTDNAGNVSVASAPRVFIVDTLAPAAPVIAAPAEGATTGVSPTVSGTAEAGALVSVFVDGGAMPACNATADAAGNFSCVVAGPLSVAPHVLTATARDGAGNISAPTPNRNIIVVAATPPGPPVIASPARNAATNDTTPSVSGTGAPGAEIRVFVDGATSPACVTTASASGSWMCDVSPALMNGPHQVQATATTAAGSSAPSLSVPFTIDTMAPGAPNITSPTMNAMTGLSPVYAGVAEPNARVEVLIDGSPTPLCTAIANSVGAWSCVGTSALTPGPHQVVARATDTAGNQGPPSAAVPFTAASGRVPTTPSITQPATNARLRETSPILKGVAAPGSTVNVFVDGGMRPACTAVADNNGQFACVPSMPLAEGTHTVTATATDTSGTSAPSMAVPFVIDTMVPPAPVIAVPIENSQTGRTPVISGTAEAESTVTVRLDGQVLCETVADTMGAWSCPVTQPLQPGPHTAVASATDGAGNTSPPTAPRAFTVLAQPMVPVLQQPASGNTVSSLPTFSGLADPGASIEVRVDGTVVCTTTANAMGRFSCAATMPLSEGSRSATVTATTPGGTATSLPTTFTVSNRPAPPTITSPSAGETTANQPQVRGTAPAASLVTVSIDGMPACTATADANGQFACIPAMRLEPGPHSVTATVTDTGGISAPSPAVTFTVGIATRPAPPIVTSPAAGSVTSNRPEFRGTAESGSTVTVRVDGSPVCTAMTDSTGQFACVSTIALEPGAHNASATASTSNGVSDASPVVSFTVQRPAIAITSPQRGGTTSQLPVISGTAMPGASVSIFVDESVVCTTTADAQGQFSCAASAPLPSGPHVVTARAGTEESAAVAFNVVTRSYSGAGIGCASSGAPPAWWLATALLLALVRRFRQQARRAAVMVVGVAAAAQAQTTVPPFELERVRLTGGAQHGLLVESADLLPQLGYRVAATLHYQHNPLILREDNKPVGAAVSSRFGLHLSGAFSPTDWLDVSLQFPVVLSQTGVDLSAQGVLPVQSGVAAGTPWVGVRGGLLQERRGSPVDLSVGVALGIPLGSSAALTKDDSISVIPSLGVGRTLNSWLRVGGSVGVLIRNAQLLSPATTIRDEVGSLVMPSVILSTTGEGLRGEISGRIDIPVTKAPVGGEVDLGVRFPLLGVMELFAVGGPGFGALPGTPTFRVLAGLALAPRPAKAIKAEEPKSSCVEGQAYVLAACPSLDRDGDGVANGQDACPTTAGVAAQRGCAEGDADKDGLLDSADVCPREAGSKANGGCPAADFDKDGVADADDACPKEAGSAARAGCPDSDGDGLADNVDACPKEAGAADRKGCPDLDADGDGVVDRLDACRNERGVKDNDGCPAKKKQLVLISKDKLVIKDKVNFATGKAVILPKSFAMLEQVASVLLEHPEVERVTIEGHTDNRGNHDANVKLSQARAEAVRLFLMRAGIQADRIRAQGFGPDKPIEANDTNQGREANRRVEFVIVGSEFTK